MKINTIVLVVVSLIVLVSCTPTNTFSYTYYGKESGSSGAWELNATITVVNGEVVSCDGEFWKNQIDNTKMYYDCTPELFSGNGRFTTPDWGHPKTTKVQEKEQTVGKITYSWKIN